MHAVKKRLPEVTMLVKKLVVWLYTHKLEALLEVV